MKAEDLRAVGIIVGAHGLQGAMKLAPLSDFPERFAALRTVYLVRGNDEPREYHVKQTRWCGSNVVAVLREVRSRNEAQALVGMEVCVTEQDAWPLPEGSYFLSDLIGFDALDEQGNRIGTLRDIWTCAQDILTIELCDGRELLVPFVGQWTGRVDLSARTIEIRGWQQLAEPEII